MGILVSVVAVILVGFVAWGLWRAGGPAGSFAIRLVDGEPKAVRGKVTPSVLNLVRDVARFHGLKQGRISGKPGPMGTRLEFSRDIPQFARQQIRNGWGALGSKAGSPRRGGF